MNASEDVTDMHVDQHIEAEMSYSHTQSNQSTPSVSQTHFRQPNKARKAENGLLGTAGHVEIPLACSQERTHMWTLIN